MILADTSVWIDHLRYGDDELGRLLNHRQILMHPFVIAELALGSLRGRAEILSLLDFLPQVQIPQISEVRLMIESRRIYNLGIGLIDAYLIGSVLMTPPTLLSTRDRNLRKAAKRFDIEAKLP